MFMKREPIGMNSPIVELKSLAVRENPVEIAGYGRESTHKGYLSWILDSRRNPFAPEVLKVLCEKANAARKYNALVCPLESPDECRCYWEKTLSERRKVDLVVVATWKDIEYAVPIELKTDSGASSSKQFEAMSATKSFGEIPIAARMVFCLGASSVLSFDTYDFVRCSIEDVLDVVKRCGNSSGKSFFSDWAYSVEAENLRLVHALDSYSEVKKGRAGFEDLGYRSMGHLFYFALSKLKSKLEDVLPGSTWNLYSGVHNTVLNLEFGGRWHRTREFRGNLFFEFNDDSLMLKLRDGEFGEEENEMGRPNGVDEFRKMVDRVWVTILDKSPPDVPVPAKPKRRKGIYRSIARWRPFDLARPEEVAESVVKILRSCGPEGCLAPFVH